jgi:hypothetical protein
MYGGDDGARTRDLCRDSQSETRNSLEPGVANGHFQRPEEPLATLIGPLMDPRPLPCKPLPNSEFGLMSALPSRMQPDTHF